MCVVPAAQAAGEKKPPRVEVVFLFLRLAVIRLRWR